MDRPIRSISPRCGEIRHTGHGDTPGFARCASLNPGLALSTPFGGSGTARSHVPAFCTETEHLRITVGSVFRCPPRSEVDVFFMKRPVTERQFTIVCDQNPIHLRSGSTDLKPAPVRSTANSKKTDEALKNPGPACTENRITLHGTRDFHDQNDADRSSSGPPEPRRCDIVIAPPVERVKTSETGGFHDAVLKSG